MRGYGDMLPTRSKVMTAQDTAIPDHANVDTIGTDNHFNIVINVTKHNNLSGPLIRLTIFGTGIPFTALGLTFTPRYFVFNRSGSLTRLSSTYPFYRY